MPFPVIPVVLGAGALIVILTQKSSASPAYSQAPADGSTPPKVEPKPPAKTWKEMPASLQEQVASALGALGVSPATGELGEGPVTADAIKLATQTAALCESQGFYDIAKELRRLSTQAAAKVPTPPAAQAMQQSAPPGLTPEQIEAITRTLTMDRDPAVISAMIGYLKKLQPSQQRDYFISMAQALLLQLQAAQSTTETLQQIDAVIKSPGIAEVTAAVQPLPTVVVPVIAPPPPPPPPPTRPPPPPPAAIQEPAKFPPQPSPQAMDRPALTLAQFKDPAPKQRILSKGSKGEDVKSWQRILKRFGYDMGAFGPNKDGVDGDFGSTSDRQTRAFQSWGFATLRDPDIKIDGKVGPVTRRLVLLRTEWIKQTASVSGIVSGRGRRRAA